MSRKVVLLVNRDQPIPTLAFLNLSGDGQL